MSGSMCRGPWQTRLGLMALDDRWMRSAFACPIPPAQGGEGTGHWGWRGTAHRRSKCFLFFFFSEDVRLDVKALGAVGTKKHLNQWFLANPSTFEATWPHCSDTIARLHALLFPEATIEMESALTTAFHWKYGASQKGNPYTPEH